MRILPTPVLDAVVDVDVAAAPLSVGSLASTSRSRSLQPMSGSLPLVNIVTMSSSSTPRPSMYHTRLPPCCAGFLSDGLSFGDGGGWSLSMESSAELARMRE